MSTTVRMYLSRIGAVLCLQGVAEVRSIRVIRRPQVFVVDLIGPHALREAARLQDESGAVVENPDDADRQEEVIARHAPLGSPEYRGGPHD